MAGTMAFEPSAWSLAPGALQGGRDLEAFVQIIPTPQKRKSAKAFQHSNISENGCARRIVNTKQNSLPRAALEDKETVR